MAKRKSLNDALNPEEEAFYQSGQGTAAPPAGPVAGEGNAIHTRRSVILPPIPQKGVSGLAILNTRIEAGIFHAMVEAGVIRKLEGKSMFTHRDIVTDALKMWLKKYGYLT